MRVIERDGDPWWVAKDVCDALGLSNITEALRGVDEDERCSKVMNTLGGTQSMTIINEPGLYSLIFRSRKPCHTALVCCPMYETATRDGWLRTFATRWE